MRSILIMGLGKSGFYASLLGIADGRFHLIVCDERIDTAIKKRKEAIIKEALKRRVPVSFYLGEDSIPDLTGVELAVVSPGVSVSHPYLVAVREKGAKVIGELEFAYRYIVDERDKIVGITGTNGKTTTTLLVSHILKSHNRRVFVGGNLGEPLSKYVLQEEIVEHIVLEVSSFQLETIERFSVSVGALLNIDEDHLDRHGSLEEYARLKFRLFKNTPSGGKAVLNREDEVIKGWLDRNPLPCEVSWFSVKEPVSCGAYMDGGWLKVRLPGMERKIVNYAQLSDEGRFNIENIMAASLIATLLGVPSEVIREAVYSFRYPPHRMEYVGEFNRRRVYNDSKATNPHAVKKALEFFRDKVILIMGGYDKNYSFSKLKPVIEEKVKLLVAYGDAADRIVEDLRGIKVPVYKVWDFEDAVKMAWSFSREGDVILLSPGCASFDQFKSYEERGEKFRELVVELGAV